IDDQDQDIGVATTVNIPWKNGVVSEAAKGESYVLWS
ncbi:hypothetical protein Tco_1063383, partial [Tanacetum coccineum]